jgi:hypothetical protein
MTTRARWLCVPEFGIELELWHCPGEGWRLNGGSPMRVRRGARLPRGATPVTAYARAPRVRPRRSPDVAKARRTRAARA